MTQHRGVEVYYACLYDQPCDEVTLTKCLRVFLQVTFPEERFVRFEKFEDDAPHVQKDIIKTGLHTFNHMYETLKLKTSNTVWFVFLANGNVLNVYNNVSVALVNQDVQRKECMYSIVNKEIRFDAGHDKSQKMEHVKLLNKSLSQLFKNKRLIRYDKVR